MIKNYNLIRSIKSDKIDIKRKKWLIYNAQIIENNTNSNYEIYELQSNFDLERIKNLFSNLSSLSLFQLFNLKENYKKLNYSTTDVEIQIQKFYLTPLYLIVMMLLSSVIMFNTKNFKRTTFKISIGLFFSVIVYYINNFFNVLGVSEKLTVLPSIWIPILSLLLLNFITLYKLNEK